LGSIFSFFLKNLLYIKMVMFSFKTVDLPVDFGMDIEIINFKAKTGTIRPNKQDTKPKRKGENHEGKKLL